jgi:arylsulfatase A-like enzyme
MRPVLYLICLCWLTISGKAIPPRPNIIIILADDLGYAELGCYGQKIIKTPHIDLLAKSGIRFTQYYAGNTVCAPSRCALLTGKHTGHSDIRDNKEQGGFKDDEERGQLALAKGQFTLAHLLKSNGYHTAVIGKWGLGMPDNDGSPLRAGFDFFYGFADQKQAHNYYPSHLWKNDQWDTLSNGYFSPHQKYTGELSRLTDDYVSEHYTRKDYAPDFMRNEALKFIDNQQQDPFFLFYTLPMPHLSLQVPLEDLKPYAGLPDTPYTGDRGYLPQAHPRAAYAAMISRLDTEVGIIMNKLKQTGKDNNTIVIFISDNGATVPGLGGADTKFFMSNGNLRGYKMDLYEGGIRVPCIVSWPGHIKEGTTNHTLSAAWDWMPTLADMIHIKAPGGLDGVSVKKELLSQTLIRPDRSLYWEYHDGKVRAIRQGDWKLIRFYHNKKSDDKAYRDELYYLATDPGEQNNLVSLYPDKMNILSGLLEHSHSTSRIKEWNIFE